MRSGAAARFRLACKDDSQSGDCKHETDYREGIAEAYYQRLVLDGIAEGNDGLLMRGRRIAHAVRQEIIRHMCDAVAHFFAAGRDRLADNIGMKLFALGLSSGG